MAGRYRSATRQVLVSLASGCAVYLGVGVWVACSSGGSSGGGLGTGGASGAGAGASTDGANSGGSSFLPPEAHAYTSGSRLKARRFVGEDGSRHFIEWFDAARGESCAFDRAEDLTPRCLPAAVAITNSLEFADAACTQRITRTEAYAYGCGPDPGYAYEQNGCNAGRRMFKVTQVLKQQNASYFLSEGQCQLDSHGILQDIYVLGAVIAPTEFVAASEQLDP